MPDSENSYKAFFSYVRQNDQHDGRKLSALRRLIEMEVWAQTAESFELFQDQDDIEWGEDWQKRIKQALDKSKFLIAVITPSYLRSEACRFEFESFMCKKKEIGEDNLILPLLYIETPELENPKEFIAAEIAKREWVDWRDLRFAGLESVKVKKKVASLAIRIRDLIAREKVIDIHRSNISIPNSVSTIWNEQWQPSFEMAKVAMQPLSKMNDKERLIPPSLYVPLIKDEGEGRVPQLITIVLRPTKNPEKDRHRIKTVYGTLISFRGRDLFSFQIFSEGKSYLIDFPHDKTRISPELLSRLKKLLGEETWHIGEITYK